ncbi:hypothetical protein EGW08_009423, partial [Elysia chlorotica]
MSRLNLCVLPHTRTHLTFPRLSRRLPCQRVCASVPARVGVSVPVDGRRGSVVVVVLLELVPELLDEVHHDDLARVVAHGAKQEDAVVAQVHVDKLLEQGALATGAVLSQDQQVLLNEVLPPFAA